MYRFLFTPRWIAFHLLVIAAVVAMINLGFWQLRRLDERQAFNEAVSSRIDLPPEPITDVVTMPNLRLGVEWRAVEASGTYLPDEQFVVVNRSEGGVAGDLVVTPMQLDDGRILLVQRGFVPLGETAAPAPTGEVDIVGRLREPQVRRRGQVSDPEEGELTEVQRIDFERLSPQLPGYPVPMWVELVSSEPAETGPFPHPVAVPELTEGPHLSYAVQWFIFSIAVVVGWVLAVRKSLNDRRTGSRGAGGASTTEVAAPQPTSS
jgi:cytochrome oxidase assembly protein ShyY1